MLKRRSVIEPIIGHLKSDQRMERNYLKRKTTDKVNDLMSAISYNFMKIMQALFLFSICCSNLWTADSRWPFAIY